MSGQPDLDVSRETTQQFERYQGLVQKWNPTINLVAKTSLESIWFRHIIDSAQLFQFAPSNAKTWLDIGSGGGFPGIVMAIMSLEHGYETKFTLIESDQRKSTFLRTAARELGLKITVLAERIEQVEPMNADVVSARALKSLDTLLPLSSRHLAQNGVCIFPKGKTWSDEIEQAKQKCRFDVKAHPSMTDKDARILVVKDLDVN